MKKTITKTEKKGESDGSKLCETSEKMMEREMDRIKTFIAHLVELLFIFYSIHLSKYLCDEVAKGFCLATIYLFDCLLCIYFSLAQTLLGRI